MRNVDWIDRLMGMTTFEEDHTLAPDYIFRPAGPWLAWPWWRRLFAWVRYMTWDLAVALVGTGYYALCSWPKWDFEDENTYWPSPAGWYDVQRGFQAIRAGVYWYCDTSGKKEENGVS